MNFYIAARYARKAEMCLIAERIENEVEALNLNARWLTTNHDGLEPEKQMRCADEDFNDIEESGVFILFDEEETISRGRNIELGYALGLITQDFGPGLIAIVGEPKSVFHHLYPDNTRFVANVDELIALLKKEFIMDNEENKDDEDAEGA